MGLNRGDLEKIPPSLTIQDAYKRLRKWYSLHAPTAEGLSDDYKKRSAQLARKLPSKPKDADVAYACLHVISNLLEWAYHQEDQHGIKMGAYTHYIANAKFGGFGNLGAAANKSSLKAAIEMGSK